MGGIVKVLLLEPDFDTLSMVDEEPAVDSARF